MPDSPPDQDSDEGSATNAPTSLLGTAAQLLLGLASPSPAPARPRITNNSGTFRNRASRVSVIRPKNCFFRRSYGTRDRYLHFCRLKEQQTTTTTASTEENPLPEPEEPQPDDEPEEPQPDDSSNASSSTSSSASSGTMSAPRFTYASAHCSLGRTSHDC